MENWFSSLLKIAGPKAFALMIGCLIIVCAERMALIQIDSLYLQPVIIIGVLCFAFSFVSFATWMAEKLGRQIMQSRENARRRKNAVENLQHLTPADAAILGYMLQHNQRVIFCEIDGGRARGLVTLGYLHLTARPNIPYGYKDWPYAVSDVVWEALQQNKKLFPYIEPGPGPLPWHSIW